MYVMLKVVSIIMVIFGGIGIITSLLAIVGASAAAALLGIGAGGMMVSIIISLIASAFLLFAGVMGIKGSGDSSKVQTLKLYGIILIALAVISTVVEIIIMPVFGGMAIVGLLLSLVLPVLYILGATKNA